MSIINDNYFFTNWLLHKTVVASWHWKFIFSPAGLVWYHLVRGFVMQSSVVLTHPRNKKLFTEQRQNWCGKRQHIRCCGNINYVCWWVSWCWCSFCIETWKLLPSKFKFFFFQNSTPWSFARVHLVLSLQENKSWLK